MSGRHPDITIQPGECWWCGGPADSREHRLKASDLRREYGKPPYTDLRTLTRFSGGDRRDFRGPNSNLVKFSPSLCMRCNDTRSQPFDAAWDTFGAHVAAHEDEILAARQINWPELYGSGWKARGADFERYVLKHAMCRVVDQLPGPVTIAGEYIDFLNCGPRPAAMEIELAIDLGVVEMLRVTRNSPSPDQSEAAEAGFLGTTDLWVQQSQSTGKWSEPQAGLCYRFIGVHWRLGAASASPFDQESVALDCSDDMFGVEFRQMLASGGEN